MKEKPIKVLLLEDDPESMELMEQLLATIKERKVLSSPAASLSKALAMLKMSAFDAIISDLGLPDSDGLETFAALHAQAPKIPIIILTAVNDTALAVQAVSQGAQDYLIKSEISQNALIRGLFYAVERNRLEQERHKLIAELRDSAARIKTLSNLLPICVGCKKIRNDKGYWEQVETYMEEHSDARFTHGLCSDCMTRLYPKSGRKT